MELILVDAVGAFDFALEMGFADRGELLLDLLAAQLTLEGVLDVDVREHGVGELSAVVGLDLLDPDAESLEIVERVA